MERAIDDAFAVSEEDGIAKLLEDADRLRGREDALDIGDRMGQRLEAKREEFKSWSVSGGGGLGGQVTGMGIRPTRTTSGGLLRHKRKAEGDSDSLFYDNFVQCDNCKGFDLVYDSGMLVCRDCAVCQSSFGYDLIGGYSYREAQEIQHESGGDKKRCVYKRSAYMDEILEQFLGTGKRFCPDWVWRQVEPELSDLCDIQEVRDVMRAKKLNRFYKFAGEFVRNCRREGSLPRLSREEHDFVKRSLLQCEKAFEKIRGDRINFPSYKYVLVQLFSRLGRPDLISEIPMLKNKNRLIQHDKLWQAICQECGWEFDPVVK